MGGNLAQALRVSSPSAQHRLRPVLTPTAFGASRLRGVCGPGGRSKTGISSNQRLLAKCHPEAVKGSPEDCPEKAQG